ncbi:MAG TPA: flagellar hook-basal body complex protein [Pseudolabrys sp.]|nr:flagellar hook-basal body complex protein [Pseudolabrys sp.]
MGLFNALTAAVGGLQAQSFAIQNISGNIANSQTIAYKDINTSFLDLVSAASVPTQQVAGGVVAYSTATNNVQGAIQQATSGTDMAVNGDGYFIVQSPLSFSGNTPIFGGVNSYTRRGDFQLDAQGYLVNGAGYYLEGLPIDPTTGVPTGSVPAPLQFQSNFLPASATTAIQYGINLPTNPVTNAFKASVPNSELLNPTNFSQNPTNDPVPATNAVVTGTAALNSIDASGGAITFDINGQTVTLSTTGGSGANGIYSPSDLVSAINTQVGSSAQVSASLNGNGDLVITSTNTPGAGDSVTVNNFSSGNATQLGFSTATATASGTNAQPATGQVVGSDVSTFVDESIDGGSITVYNGAGSPASLQFRWAKVDSVAAGGQDTWELFYQTDSTATGSTVAWQNAGQDFVFDASGKLSPAITTLTLNNVTLNGNVIGNLTVNSPVGSITQFASTSGNSTVNNLQQNGYAAGQLQGIAVGANGDITGTFSNGQSVALANIPLVHFNSPNNLKSLDGGAYQETAESGPALSGASGQIVGQSLEGSNADIATEFTKLIVTQQAYSANTKVITTANQMSQDLLNIIR